MKDTKMTTFVELLEDKMQITIDDNPYAFEMALNNIANNFNYLKQATEKTILDKVADLREKQENFRGFDFEDEQLVKLTEFIEHRLMPQSQGYENVINAVKTELQENGLNYRAFSKKANPKDKTKTLGNLEANKLLEKFDKKQTKTA